MRVVPDAMAGAWDRVARIEEVAAIWRRLGERLNLAFGLVWLAFAYGRRPPGRRPRHRPRGPGAVPRGRQRHRGRPRLPGPGVPAELEGRHSDAIRMAAVAEHHRDLAGGGPTPGFGGMLEGDPVAEARAHLTDEAAQQAWQDGLTMTVPEAIAVVRAGTAA